MHLLGDIFSNRFVQIRCYCEYYGLVDDVLVTFLLVSGLNTNQEYYLHLDVLLFPLMLPLEVVSSMKPSSSSVDIIPTSMLIAVISCVAPSPVNGP